jgi:hypothetical protein
MVSGRSKSEDRLSAAAIFSVAIEQYCTAARDFWAQVGFCHGAAGGAASYVPAF